jgi:hypothetical protein
LEKFSASPVLIKSLFSSKETLISAAVSAIDRWWFKLCIIGSNFCHPYFSLLSDCLSSSSVVSDVENTLKI